jgi:hypothetical protein
MTANTSRRQKLKLTEETKSTTSLTRSGSKPESMPQLGDHERASHSTANYGFRFNAEQRDVLDAEHKNNPHCDEERWPKIAEQIRCQPPQVKVSDLLANIIETVVLHNPKPQLYTHINHSRIGSKEGMILSDHADINDRKQPIKLRKSMV